MVKNKLLIFTAVISTFCLALSGCGSTGDGPDQGGTEASGEVETSDITVADTAGMPSTFLEYGVEEGFFEAEGLTVSVDVSSGGAAAVPAVVSGSVQMAGSNTEIGRAHV